MEWNFLFVSDWISVCLSGTPTKLDSAFQPFDVDLDTGGEVAVLSGVYNGVNRILEQIGCTEFKASCTGNNPDASSLNFDLSIVSKQCLKPTAQKFSDPSIQQSSSSSNTVPPIPPGHLDFPPVTSLLSENVAMPLDKDVSSKVTHATTSPGESYEPDPPPESVWHWTEVLVDVKLNPEYFPFPEHDFLSAGRKHGRSRSHLALRAFHLFKIQHRTHVFMISISGRRARFLRFDHSGAVVSTSFDYTTTAGVAFIGQFLYGLFRPSATPEDRGADPTATLASDDEARFFASLPSRFSTGPESRIGERFEDAANGTWPIRILSITSAWSQLGGSQEPLPVRKENPVETHRCLVGKPMYIRQLFMGRGTRCFVGWDLDGGRPVMIKDSWRADLESIQTELDVYMTLWEGETTVDSTYIPTPLGGGDVYREAGVMAGDSRQYQRTLALAEPSLSSTSRGRRIPRIHTRLVLKEICESLEDFVNPEQLVSVIFHALIAHALAWRNHKILHRDISVQNILIYYEKLSDDRYVYKGLLSDWDLARTEDQLPRLPMLTWRSETWEYMSSLLQHMHGKHYEVSDDLESFMHVLNWCALRYLPSPYSMDPCELALYMHSLFTLHNSRKLENGTIIPTGGRAKLEKIREGKPFAWVIPSDHPFAGLLETLASLCQQHYATYDTNRVMSLSQPRKDLTRSAKSQRAAPEPSLNLLEYVLKTTTIPLEFLGEPGNKAKSASPVEPTTPTVASSSRLSTPSTRTVADRSESPLLDHVKFMRAFAKILKDSEQVQWDLFPKGINKLEYQSGVWDSHMESLLTSGGLGVSVSTVEESGRSSGGLLRTALLRSLADQP